MRGIDRLIAGLLLVGAVAGAAVFAHGLGRGESSAPLVFAAAPPAAPQASSTVRIQLPAAPTQRLARPAVSRGRATLVLPARREAPPAHVSIAVTPIARLQPVVVRARAPRPSAAPKTPAPKTPVQRAPAAPAVPALPPTQQAHVKVPLTPTDPSRILATTPSAPSLTPTPPTFHHDDGQAPSSDAGQPSWSSHGNNGNGNDGGHGHGRSHAD